MQLDELIGGLIGVSLVGAFLSFYALRVRSIPLGIIIVAILVMVLVNFYEGLTKGKNRKGG